MRLYKKNITRKPVSVLYPRWPWLPLSLLISLLLLIYNEGLELNYFVNPFFYLALIVGMLIGMVLIFIVYKVTLYLDREFPWYRNYNKRFKYQIIGGVLIPIFIAFILISIYFLFAGINVFKTIWIREYLLQIVLLLLISNFAFQYYWHKSWNGKAFLKKRNKGKISKIIPITLEIEIACVFSDSKQCYVINLDGIGSLQMENMDQIERKLPSQYFYKINRSTIINLNSIKEIEKVSNKIQFAILPAAVSKTIYQILKARPQPKSNFIAFKLIEEGEDKYVKLKITYDRLKLFAVVYHEFKSWKENNKD